MDIFSAIIIGVIEGFTEFLPISSTGHMIVVSKFLGIEQNEMTKAYEVVIQFAAIMAVILIYKEKLSPKRLSLWAKLIVAFLPIGIVGYLFKDRIKALFSIEVVAWMFIIGGVIFLIVEYFYEEDRAKITSIEQVSLKHAFLIGIAQIFSLIPGTSRAGATIIGALLLGLDRKIAAEFSFLLAIPVMAVVSGYDLLRHYKAFLEADIVALGIGFVTAFAIAYVTIKLFLAFLSRFTFVPFGIYRILFGLFLLLFYL